MRWLRPTRVTCILIPLPLAAWLALVALGLDGAAMFTLLLVVELPFRLWRALGLPVGRHTDFYGWPDPNALGWALIALTDLLAWYVVVSAVVAAVRAARGRVT